MSGAWNPHSYPVQASPPPGPPLSLKPETAAAAATIPDEGATKQAQPSGIYEGSYPVQASPPSGPPLLEPETIVPATTIPDEGATKQAQPSGIYGGSYPVQASPPPGTALSLKPETAAAATTIPDERATKQTQPSRISEGSESTAAVSHDLPTPELPKLPRHIRALKDGKNGKVGGRNVVICLDGTGDRFDSDNSNIVHFVSCLKKSDPSQVTYYQSGIGTYDGGGLSNGFNAGLDMAIGSGLGVHIRDAYQFLMQNYREGDRICLFGFSRGAYTARCLSGMVHKVGILPAHNVSQVSFAYQFYKDDSPEGWEMSREFKRTFCADVSVHFVGVFDSVASVGFIPRKLPLSSTPYNKATYFRHAMALDEHRAKFKICRFQSKDHIGGADSKWETLAELHEDAASGQPARKFSSNLGLDEKEEDWRDEVDPVLKRKRTLEMAKQTDVLEVWFTGAHADVGGGAVKNNIRHKLAQVPLRWMIRQCFECNTGIIFKTHRLAEQGLDVHTLWPVYKRPERPLSRPPQHLMEQHKQGKIAPIQRRATLLKPVDEEDPEGLHDVALWKDERQQELHEHWVPEHVEDYFDAVAPLNDQLVQAKGWWVLEVWPIKVRVQPQGSDKWVKKVGLNMGRYRPVQDGKPNLHWTVQQRIDTLGYKAQVRLDRKSKWNIVV